MPIDRNRQTYKIAATFAVLFAAQLATPAVSRALHFDYLVEQNASGQLVTGTNDFDNGNALTLPVRVFYRDLDYLPDGTSFGSDPGYSAVSSVNVPDGYLALPPSTGLFFDMMAVSIGGQSVSNLWYWNGQGDVNFQPAVGETFTLSVGNNSVSVDGSAAGVTGLKLQNTSSTGSAHFHPSYHLTSTLGGVPTEGVYMIAQEVRMPGLENSIPYYTLFVTNTITNAAYSDAQNWAKADLVVPGDVNNDGIVDIQDVTLAANHWLQTAPGGDNKYIPIGDANYDGVVDIQDITLMANHWLQTVDSLGGGAALATPVPEPATLALSLIGAALLVARALSAGADSVGSAHRRATNHSTHWSDLIVFYSLCLRCDVGAI
jgi:hypothetical protein